MTGVEQLTRWLSVFGEDMTAIARGEQVKNPDLLEHCVKDIVEATNPPTDTGEAGK